MSFNPVVNRLARMMSRPDNGPGRAPRQHTTTNMLGTVVSIDAYQGTATINLRGKDIPGIRCTFTDLRPGDVAVLSVTGPSVSVSGRQSRIDTTPTGILS